MILQKINILGNHIKTGPLQINKTYGIFLEKNHCEELIILLNGLTDMMAMPDNLIEDKVQLFIALLKQ